MNDASDFRRVMESKDSKALAGLQTMLKQDNDVYERKLKERSHIHSRG